MCLPKKGRSETPRETALWNEIVSKVPFLYRSETPPKMPFVNDVGTCVSERLCSNPFQNIQNITVPKPSATKLFQNMPFFGVAKRVIKGCSGTGFFLSKRLEIRFKKANFWPFWNALILFILKHHILLEIRFKKFIFGSFETHWFC